MPEDEEKPQYKDPRKEDIVYGDRRISRPDLSLPDWDIPDGAYRPIPIVWFTGALVAQVMLGGILSAALRGQSGWLSIIVTGLTTGIIGAWTWHRGMKKAGLGWQIATILMLCFWLGVFCLGASARI